MSYKLDTDVDRFARSLIAEFGARAPAYAATTMALMKDRGDAEGISLWRRIDRAINRLSRRPQESLPPEPAAMVSHRAPHSI